MNFEWKITFSVVLLLVGCGIVYSIISETTDESIFVVNILSYVAFIVLAQFAIRKVIHSLRYDENSEIRSLLKMKLTYFVFGVMATFFLISYNAEFIAQGYDFGDQTDFDTQIEFLTNTSHGVLAALLLVTFFYVGKFYDSQKGLNHKFSIIEEYFHKSKSRHRPMTDEERQDVSGFYHFVSRDFLNNMFEFNRIPTMAIGVVLVLSIFIGMTSWSLNSNGIPNSVEYVKSVAPVLLITGSFVMIWIHFHNMLDGYRKYEFWMDRQIATIKASVPAESFSKRVFDDVENA